MGLCALAVGPLLACAEAEAERIRVSPPERPAAAETAIVAARFARGQIRVQAYDASDELVFNVDTEELTGVEVVFFSESLSELALESGSVVEATPTACARRALPPPASVFTLDWSSERYSARSTLSPELESYRYEVPCPCAPFEIRRVDTESIGEQFVALVPLRSGDIGMITNEKIYGLDRSGVVRDLGPTPTFAYRAIEAPDGDLVITSTRNSVWKGDLERGFEELHPALEGVQRYERLALGPGRSRLTWIQGADGSFSNTPDRPGINEALTVIEFRGGFVETTVDAEVSQFHPDAGYCEVFRLGAEALRMRRWAQFPGTDTLVLVGQRLAPPKPGEFVNNVFTLTPPSEAD